MFIVKRIKETSKSVTFRYNTGLFWLAFLLIIFLIIFGTLASEVLYTYAGFIVSFLVFLDLSEMMPYKVQVKYGSKSVKKTGSMFDKDNPWTMEFEK